MAGTERYVRNSTADFFVFTKDSETDGIEVRVQDHEVWLTQKGIGQLFDVDRSVVAKHLRNIFAENELSESTTCAKFAQVADNGKTYHYKFYSLPAIIAVGYRTNSTRATQFRQWATKVLDTFTRQGYVLDKDRLINGQIFDEDYFDHLVSEIQEIRASERRFYQKITDIYATAVDYSVDSKTTKDFFATVQNKMHYAVHGSTAAEVIVQRADHTKDHMGLTSWKNAPNGKIVKADVSVAKNYLQQDELQELNEIVTMYLDYATRELKQYGVEVYFVNDGIWTMDGDGEVRLTIMASIAQDESRKTSERVKAGQKMSREKGVLYGSGNIIGYDRVDGTYVINEEQAATVRRIFNLYAEGHGETTVAKMLIEENRKDGGGGLSWTASKVSRVLRKPTYKGYMTYNKSHIDDFLSHNRINHSEEDFVLVKGNFEPIVSEALWETCNQIRSKRAAFVKGKDGRAHKFGVSFPQNKWTKILFCDCGMRFQIEGYDKTANGGKNMRLICARSKMFKKKDAARALNGIPCPAPYASEWKLELMAREVFRTVWKENAEDILGLLRMLDANLNTTGTPNDGNQLENKLSALNEELDDLVSQRASRSITMDDFLSRSTEINNEIINVEGLLQSSIQEQRPKARLDMHSIEAALSDDASFPDGKIEPGFLDRYANRIVKSNNRYIWMLQLVNVQQIMPIQSERQPIAMVTYKSGVPYDIEQEQTGKQDKESAGPDCATICRPQDFFLNMSRTKRKRKLVEWLESCQENQVNVLDEKIPLLSFAVDFVTAYEYQKARGIKIHPGLWKDMRVDIFLVKKEN